MNKNVLLASILGLALIGCGSQDVPQAHKGRMFNKTGLAAFYVGGTGFEGPVLGPGTHYTGMYDEVRMIDCSRRTVKESMKALTKDGVQFGLDVYVAFSAKCDENEVVVKILDTLSPQYSPLTVTTVKDGKEVTETIEESKSESPTLTITSNQMYTTFIRPALGEAVRECVSPFIANQINMNREEIFQSIRKRFDEILGKQKPQAVSIFDLNLSNLDFPQVMDDANTERAVQSVLTDKAIAQRERVTAEIETAKMRKSLAETEAGNEAARIDAIGAALKRNPEYTQLELFKAAGEKGNMIVLSPDQKVLLSPKK